MKNALPITIATALLPTLAMGAIDIRWSVTNVPKYGLTDITFPFSIANSPHRTGFYFAQQFRFLGQREVGYAGLQPRPDTTINNKTTPVIHAVFSSFINGSTTTDGNCHSGADGSPAGVSCSVEFSESYADAYHLEIRNTEGKTWSGTLVDTTTGRRIHVGSYTLPANTQGIADNWTGFVEYFPWNAVPTINCTSLPYTSVVFGVPTTSTSGATGSLGDANHSGVCVGKVPYESHRTETKEVEISVGFK